jgi:uncharacterized protein (TIGR02996 family)
VITEPALLEAIRLDRHSDGPRLVYADWLSERGDPRGEFIRVQCTLARGDSLAPDVRWELRERAEDLLAEHGAGWRAAAGAGAAASFRRGFPDLAVGQDVDLAIATVRRNVCDYLQITNVPVSRRFQIVDELVSLASGIFVAPRDHNELWPVLVKSPHAHALAQMDFMWGRLDKRQVAELLAAPWQRLRSLGLKLCQLDDDDVTGLAAAPRLQGLRKLDVSRSRVGPRGVAGLAGLPQLEALELEASELMRDPTSLAGLSPTLRVLGVGECGMTDEAFAAMLPVARWREGLVDLHARTSQLGGATLRMAIDVLPSLRVLSLDGYRTGAVDFRRARALEELTLVSALAFTPVVGLPPELRALSLSDSQLQDDLAIEILRAAPPHLRRLALHGTRTGAPTIQHLAGAPQRLRFLSIGGASADSLRLLAEAPAFAGLRFLSIHTPLTDDDIRTFRHPRLTSLLLGGMTRKQVELILADDGLPRLTHLSIPRDLPPRVRAKLRARGVIRFHEVGHQPEQA